MRKYVAGAVLCALLAALLCACARAPEADSEIDREVVDESMREDGQDAVELDSQDSQDAPARAVQGTAPVKIDCPDCGGLGDLPCPPCGETGSVQCQQCEGRGVISCQYCDGGGQTPCASCDGMGEGYCAACEGTGTFGDEYTAMRFTCAFCGGDGRADCDYCGGSGTWDCVCGGKSVCDNCSGQGNTLCQTCGGAKRLRCETCKGEGSQSVMPDGTVNKSGGASAVGVSGVGEDVHPCPDCGGEGRAGECANCGGSGYDVKTKQICTACLATGKNSCDTCKGYGMLDSQGNGVRINVPQTQTGGVNDPSGTENNTKGELCNEPKCKGGVRLCGVCKGAKQVERVETGPYYGGKNSAMGTKIFLVDCSGCKGRGYVDCVRCGGDGRIYD